MFKTHLPEKLYELPGFQRIYRSLIIASVRQQFHSLEYEDIESDNFDWNYLLFCASIFAQSENGKCLDAAFRIAQFCLSSLDTDETHKSASGVILDILTNSSSINLAIEREYLNKKFIDYIPLSLKLDMIKRGIKYSIASSNNEDLFQINKFQLSVYQEAALSDWISISAPTSAGKSYILLRLLEEHFLKNKGTIGVYLVPTRALIQQVETDISSAFKKLNLDHVTISSIPSLNEGWEKLSLLFVLTQERLQWIMNDESGFAPDIIIIDEAQKIGDGSRGILLQQVLEEVIQRSPESKFLFSSPMTENPEIFLGDAPNSTKKRSINSEYVAVNQNLIWVSQIHNKPKEWSMELCIGDDNISLGNFELPARPTHESKRLSFVSYVLADKKGGNLIYVNNPSDAEKTALQLWDLQGTENVLDDPDINELIKLSEKVINKNYSLNFVLTRGVGYHYGNMPLIIKNEIERLFKNGNIKFLVCTSTLIEGVNLPAKSIFVRGPKKGRGKPLSEIDFWNLAGRAGRQGKEFQGNVICLDPNRINVWNSPPPKTRKKYTINKMVDNIVLENGSELLSFIQSETPREIAANHPEYEYAFTYFVTDFIKNQSLNHHLQKYGSEFISQLTNLCKSVIDLVEVPKNIIVKNPGISPIAQQSLLNYFKSFNGEIDELIPALPESESAYESYVRVIGRISTHLSGEHPALSTARAVLVLNWMRGMSLARIIEENWRYWSKKDPTKKLPSVIRETMKDVEEYARFKFVKYSSCYTDILQYFLIKKKVKREVIDQIPQLKLWLEFGASQKTQISLMGLGLSRTSAIIISELIGNDSLDINECINWLRSINTEAIDMSPIVMEEIRRIVK